MDTPKEANHLPTIALGDSRQLQPGQWVLALGHPWGVLGAVTAGIVIDIGRPPEIPSAALREFIQVGLHLRPGHSGGPLVDVQGRLVGINTISQPTFFLVPSFTGSDSPCFITSTVCNWASNSIATGCATAKAF